MAFNALPLREKTVFLEVPLPSYRGQLLNYLGKTMEGEVWFRKCCDLRAQAVPPNLWESTFSAENLVNGIATNNNFQDALMWHKKSADFWYNELCESMRKNDPPLDPNAEGFKRYTDAFLYGCMPHGEGGIGLNRVAQFFPRST